MLKRIEITNYHGFQNPVILDFSGTKNYSYSKDLIKNGLVKNSIVFGRNGSGKSSLCLAVMDITLHLLDRQKDRALQHPYSFVGNNDLRVGFRYIFQFGKRELIYYYEKTAPMSLSYEEISVNGKKILVHNYTDESENFIGIQGAKQLKTNGLQPELSCVKYVYNNTIHSDNSELAMMMNFVGGMLYFRSLREGNEYIGFKLGGDNLDDIILRNNKLSEFSDFLKTFGLKYSLIPIRLPNGISMIGIKFDNNRVVSFEEIASSGTQALKLFYCWLLDFPKLTFLVIDEFDAFYDYETAGAVLNLINSFENMQSLVTTHNVTLLSTRFTRPDCAYLIDKHGVVSLSKRINRDLRKGNNIEKMYREGEFSMDEEE